MTSGTFAAIVEPRRLRALVRLAQGYGRKMARIQAEHIDKLGIDPDELEAEIERVVREVRARKS